METKHERQVRKLVEHIMRLRASLPESMWNAMERRLCSQVSVAVATDALILVQEKSNAKK